MLNVRSVLAIICFSSHRRLKIGLERLKIYQNEAMELVDKDFKEKIKKNNVLRPHSLWFGLLSPPCRLQAALFALLESLSYSASDFCVLEWWKSFFFLFSLLGIVVVAEKKHGKLLIVGILFVARSSEIRFTTHKRANLASRQIKLGIGRVFPWRKSYFADCCCLQIILT